MNKFILYQLLPRLFTNSKNTNIQNGTIEQNGCGKLNDFSYKALESIKTLGVTHVWFTGLIEHATQTDYTKFGIRKDHDEIVKGKAGSAYAIKDYYDIDPDLAVDVSNRMKEFENLVQRVHKSGLKFVMDFVPNHVAREYFSDSKPSGVKDLGETDCTDWHFSPLNNFYYMPGESLNPEFGLSEYSEFPAKATGNDQFSSRPNKNDWYETIKLNYGVYYTGGGEKQFDPIPNTWHKMLDILLFWASKHIDAFRCDMAEMVPVEFWHWAIAKVKAIYPDLIFIAEVYNPDLYRSYIYEGGFDYLYDKVGMYDTLRDIVCSGQPAWNISREWQKNDDIADHLLEFFENHDEQRIASDFFAGKAEKAFPAMIVLAALHRAPLMIYAGQELGEAGMEAEGFSGRDGRTTIFDYWGVNYLQSWVNKGKFDGGLLSSKQLLIRDFYQRLCTLSLSNEAISKGIMYDLQFANFDNMAYDTTQQFSWFRKFNEELVLIVVNFSSSDQDIEIMIPDQAKDYLGIQKSGRYELTDILHFSTLENWNVENKLKVSLDAANGKIIKLSLI